MLSCKEIVKFLGGKESPSWTQRIELRMHLFACHHCNRYAKQLQQIASAWKNLCFGDGARIDPESVKRIETEVLKRVR